MLASKHTAETEIMVHHRLTFNKKGKGSAMILKTKV